MCSRRNKPFFQAVLFIGIVGGLGYGLFLYNELSHKFQRSERQVKKYSKHQESLNAQLQVVYEHRARLEKSLQKEKSDHKQTKKSLEYKQHQFMQNFTKTKHETMNRFNSLDTQHNMLKAKHEEVQLEYSRLQQQHARLSSDHSQVHQQLTRQLEAFKEQKANEISALEEQLKTLTAKIASLKNEVESHKTMASRYKSLHHDAHQERERQKITILKLKEQLGVQKNLLNQYARKRNSKLGSQNEDKREEEKPKDAEEKKEEEQQTNQNEDKKADERSNEPNKNAADSREDEKTGQVHLRPRVVPYRRDTDPQARGAQNNSPVQENLPIKGAVDETQDVGVNRPDIGRQGQDQSPRDRPVARGRGPAHTLAPDVTSPWNSILEMNPEVPTKGVVRGPQTTRAVRNVKTKGGSEEEGEGEQNRGEKNEEAEQDPDVRKYLHQAVKPQPLDKHAPKPGHVDWRSRHQRDVRDGDKLGFHRKPIPKPIYLKDTEQPDHVERNDERDDGNAEANVDETELQQEGGDDAADPDKDADVANANHKGLATTDTVKVVGRVHDGNTADQDTMQVIGRLPDGKTADQELAEVDREEEVGEARGEQPQETRGAGKYRKRRVRDRALKAIDKN